MTFANVAGIRNICSRVRFACWKALYHRPPLVYLFPGAGKKDHALFHAYRWTEDDEDNIVIDAIAALWHARDNSIYIGGDFHQHLTWEAILAHESLHYVLFRLGEWESSFTLDNLVTATKAFTHSLENSGLCERCQCVHP